MRLDKKINYSEKRKYFLFRYILLSLLNRQFSHSQDRRNFYNPLTLSRLLIER